MNLQAADARQRWPRLAAARSGECSPVAGCELTPPQVRGGDDAAAFVLAVADGAGHLQHPQHPPVPDAASRPLDPHPLLVDGRVVFFTERQRHPLVLTACFS